MHCWQKIDGLGSWTTSPCRCRTHWGTGESSSRIAISVVRRSFFRRSVLTRRRKGVLSGLRAQVLRRTHKFSLSYRPYTRLTVFKPQWSSSYSCSFRNRRTHVFDNPEHHCVRASLSSATAEQNTRFQSNPPIIAFPISPYGKRPVNRSIIAHPSEQISDFVDVPLSSMTSGAT